MTIFTKLYRCVQVDGSRKCFRLVGGVLVERTVKEVLPALVQNQEKISSTVDSLSTNLMAKGKELNDYREKYNITVRGENQGSNDTASEQNAKPNQASGVLVSNSK